MCKTRAHRSRTREVENASRRHRPVRTASVADSARPIMCSSVHDQNVAMGFLCEEPCGMDRCKNVLQQHLVKVQASQLVLNEQGLFAIAHIEKGTVFATFGPLILCNDPAPTGSVGNYRFPIRPTGGGAKQWYVPKQPGLTSTRRIGLIISVVTSTVTLNICRQKPAPASSAWWLVRHAAFKWAKRFSQTTTT